MGLYSNVLSGTTSFKSRFHKSLSFTKSYDCRFGEIIPVLAKFCLPGDVWRIGGDALVRFQPMRTPSLTPCKLKVRYFFVPIRLIHNDTELIITGSSNGQLSKNKLPEFPNFVANADKTVNANAYKLTKWSFWDYMGCQIGDYESIKNNKCLPAGYWRKAYTRILWDFYRDENLSNAHQTYADFESLWNANVVNGCNASCGFVELPKDYFTSSLPWQLKGTAPAISWEGVWTPQFNTTMFSGGSTANYVRDIRTAYYNPYDPDDPNDKYLAPFVVTGDTQPPDDAIEQIQERFDNNLNRPQNFKIDGLFDGSDLRTMMAQTRIFERLARCGSRYTEYLHSNFGVAPADETLQRAKYLGGWSLPIITTEVLQTAEDGSTPVGTMRGHGITRGGNRCDTFFCKEFGVIFGLAHILPNIEYTNGIPKEFTYKSRFDFFNPSFQHLSEQEVRNGELYISFSDGKNDDTFGFQAYANELRTSVDLTVGDLRDSLSDWTQSINFGNTRPNLDAAFLSSESYLTLFNKCFAVQSADARPCIVQFYNDLDVYRPMVRYSTPGLVDHL